MQLDDFFIEPPSLGPVEAATERQLDVGFLERLRRQPAPNLDDLAVAVALAQLYHHELELFGTGGGETLTSQGSALVQRTLLAVLRRLGVDFSLPWRDFGTFKNHWVRLGYSGPGGYRARRQLLAEHFEPLHARLAGMEDAAMASNLAEPVSARTTTGWPRVDEEIRELRRRFRAASTPQDYRAIGTHCVGVLEALSTTVYDPQRHLRPGESEPPVDKTNQRIGRFLEDAVAGTDNEAVRAVAVKAAALAHSVKHRGTPTRRDAGIAADAVILLANIVRRIAQES